MYIINMHYMLNNEETCDMKQQYEQLYKHYEHELEFVNKTLDILILNNLVMYVALGLMIINNLNCSFYFLNSFINFVWYTLRYLTICYIWINNNLIKPSINLLKHEPNNSIYKYVVIIDAVEHMRFKTEGELLTYYSNIMNDLDDDVDSSEIDDIDVVHYMDENLVYYSTLKDIVSILTNHNDTERFHKSNISFFSCHISIEFPDSGTFNFCIDLKQFMVVGNKIFNFKFITWYVNYKLPDNSLGFELDQSDIYKCKITILDENINQLVFSYDVYNTNQYVYLMEIKKNNYVLHERKNDRDMGECMCISDNECEDGDNSDSDDDDISESSTSENELDKTISDCAEEQTMNEKTECEVDNKSLHICSEDCKNCMDYDKLENINYQGQSLFVL